VCASVRVRVSGCTRPRQKMHIMMTALQAYAHALAWECTGTHGQGSQADEMTAGTHDKEAWLLGRPADIADQGCWAGADGAGEGMRRAWGRYLATPTGQRDPEADTISSTLAAYAAAASSR
jgi:hypothetical protein